MNEVKINTKEKFHAITVSGPVLTATLTGEMAESIVPLLQNDASLPDRQVKNVVLILKDIETMESAAAGQLVGLQQQFYEQNASFVICELRKPVEQFLDEQGLLELMNVTPTESEAWDIVQMEEIERELMDDTDKFEF